MTTYYLINEVQIGGTGVLWPGALINSAYDPVATIQAAGGVLAASSNSAVATAATQAQAVKLRGGPISQAQAIMMAAYSSSNNAGVQGSPGAQGAAGAQGSPGAQGAQGVHG